MNYNNLCIFIQSKEKLYNLYNRYRGISPKNFPTKKYEQNVMNSAFFWRNKKI